MFLTDTQIKSALAAVLKMPSANDLPAYWDELIVQGHLQAWTDVLEALLARGFTSAQVGGWEGGAAYERSLALYHTLTLGGALEAFSDTFIKALDRREALKTVLVSVAGVWVNPPAADGGPGQCSSGPIDSSHDLFVLDPDDDRRGEPTQW